MMPPRYAALLKLGLSCMIVQPPQRNVEGSLHGGRLASIFIGAPPDEYFMGDRVPGYGIIAVIEFNVTLPVFSHCVGPPLDLR